MNNRPTAKQFRIDDLPPELRARIFGFALGGRILHVSENSQIVGACSATSSRAGDDADHISTSSRAEDDTDNISTSSRAEDDMDRISRIRATRSDPDAISNPGFYSMHHTDCRDKPNVALLYLSRQTYQEAKPIFYGTNDFQFSSILAFHRFIRRPQLRILKQIRHITLVISIDPRTDEFEDNLEPFLLYRSRRGPLKTAVSRLEGVEIFQMLLEIRSSSTGWPNHDTVRLLKDVSNLLPGSKTACMYYPVDRSVDARLSEESLVHFEHLASGGDGRFFDSGDEDSSDESRRSYEHGDRDWSDAYTGESSDDDERWDDIYDDDIDHGDGSEDIDE